MDIQIRQAKSADAPAIGAAQREIAKTPGFFCSQPSEITDQAVAEAISACKFFVAECDGQLVAHAFLEPFKVKVLSHVNELNMAVHIGWQNKGIGKQLLNHIIEWAQQSKTLERIQLSVRATNIPALVLYSSAGFKEEGRLKNYLKVKDGYIDDVIMSLNLNSAKKPHKDVVIRPLQKEDLNKITKTFCFPWTTPEATAEKWNVFYNEQQAGLRTVYLVEEEGEFFGYASLLRVSQYPPFREARIPEVHDVWILENHRKHGLGEMLVRHLEVVALKEGYSTIGLGVGLYQDYGSAQKLYFHLGYIPDGKGIMYNGLPVVPGVPYAVDDDLNLWLRKKL